MKVVQLTRKDLYVVVAAAFGLLGVKPRLLELGVHAGHNAEDMLTAMQPSRMVLVDQWSPEMTRTYSPFDALPPWVSPIESYAPYFGGPLREQATFDRLLAQCRLRFQSRPEVDILQSATDKAIELIRRDLGIDAFDLIYIDANHQYEFVLRDLMLYQDLLAPSGCLMLNDCCFSVDGTRQNLGVLEAVSNFLKRSAFRPIALTCTDWSDLILARPGSPMAQALDHLLQNSEVSYVELPDQLLPAARVVRGERRVNLSFA